MDDMKKAAYILAKELLETGESDYVCLALRYALEEILGGGVPFLEIPEMFPEFVSLFDGFCWGPAGYGSVKSAASSIWWLKNWKEPRVRIIDMIMSQE